MIRLFRKIRLQLLAQDKYSVYLLYAAGEIILVVVGILLALRIDNWNDSKKDTLQEITILENLHEDILSDTTDIRFNMRFHKVFLEEEKALLDFLLSDQLSPMEPIDYTNALGIPLVSIIHQSSYNNLQNNDPGIITNNELRKKISRHYDFFVDAVLVLENNLTSYNTYDKKLPYFLKHFRTLDSIHMESYAELMNENYINLDIVRKKIEIKNISALKMDEEFKIILSECILFRQVKIKAYEALLNGILDLDQAFNKELIALRK